MTTARASTRAAGPSLAIVAHTEQSGDIGAPAAADRDSRERPVRRTDVLNAPSERHPDLESAGRPTNDLPPESAEYLDAIRPNGFRDLWQLFPDRDHARRAEQLLIPRGRGGGYLRARNEHGLGVFVAMSDFEVARRLIENVVKVLHIWVDLDGAPLPRSWSLRPHAVVNTSPGKFQAVWRIEDAPQERLMHNRVIVALARVHRADEGAQGLNRVLRVPGFFHRKGEPHMVRLISARDHRAWRMAEVAAAWPTVGAVLANPPRRHRDVRADRVVDTAARSELGRQVARVATVPPPELRPPGSPGRNTVLASAAFIAGLLVGRGVISEITAVGVMADAAVKAGLSPGEATRTAERQVAAGAREARS